MSDRSRLLSPTWIPIGVAGLGATSALVTLGEIVARTSGLAPVDVPFVAGLVTSLPFSVFLLAGGLWLRGSDLSAARYRRLGLWILAGLGFFSGLFSIIAVFIFSNFWERLGTIRWGVAVGSGGGFLVGIFEARAIQKAVVAERATVRSAELERRQELLDYLNGLLRHEVLNTANIIEGYAELLADANEDSPRTRDYLDCIRTEAAELTAVTEDVRLLLTSAERENELEPRNLCVVVRQEVDRLQDRYESVSVETRLEEETFVPADDLLRRIFSNLLTNAVEHHDGESPQVSVALEAGSDNASVHIEDDGPGIPESEREGLFDRTTGTGDDHGLGLSIVDSLAHRYDGSVELAETGPDGSVFTVTLPVTDAPSATEDTTDDLEWLPANP